MTVEIAVLNRHAVALAADSAVTLEGPATHKNFDSHDKLFDLGGAHAVGVLTSGNAYFTGIPWEVVIKSFAATIGRDRLDRVDDYVSEFLAFLRSENRLFDPEQQRQAFATGAQNALRALLGEFGEAVGDTDTGFITPRVFNAAARAGNKMILSEVLDLPTADGCSPDQEENLLRLYRPTLDAALEEVWLEFAEDGRAKLARDNREALLRLVVRSYCREGNELTGDASQLVFAGFGDKQHFPTCTQVVLWPKVGGQVPALRDDPTAVGADDPGIVLPLGNSRAIDTFISGIDPFYRDQVIAEFDDRLRRSVSRVVTATDLTKEKRAALRKRAIAIVEKEAERFSTELTSWIHEAVEYPFLEAVGLLPARELANVAEWLIRIAILREKMSLDLQTVGGPVDVALISKGDGFAWVKRKDRTEDSVPAWRAEYPAVGRQTGAIG